MEDNFLYLYTVQPAVLGLRYISKLDIFLLRHSAELGSGAGNKGEVEGGKEGTEAAKRINTINRHTINENSAFSVTTRHIEVAIPEAPRNPLAEAALFASSLMHTHSLIQTEPNVQRGEQVPSGSTYSEYNAVC